MNVPQHFEPELEAYRSYLIVLAKQQIPGMLRGRLDASDIVQDTLMEAHRQRAQFRGIGEVAYGSWLRKILSGNLIDAFRMHQRQGRDVRREQQLADAVEQSAMRLDQLLVADQTSVGGKLERHERGLAVAQAMLALPEMQRLAVEMRYCQQKSVAEIGSELDKSATAVAGLIKRGIARLRELLAAAEGPSSESSSPNQVLDG